LIPRIKNLELYISEARCGHSAWPILNVATQLVKKHIHSLESLEIEISSDHLRYLFQRNGLNLRASKLAKIEVSLLDWDSSSLNGSICCSNLLLSLPTSCKSFQISAAHEECRINLDVVCTLMLSAT
jgi:hypothetical protein